MTQQNQNQKNSNSDFYFTHNINQLTDKLILVMSWLSGFLIINKFCIAKTIDLYLENKLIKNKTPPSQIEAIIQIFGQQRSTLYHKLLAKNQHYQPAIIKMTINIHYSPNVKDFDSLSSIYDYASLQQPNATIIQNNLVYHYELLQRIFQNQNKNIISHYYLFKGILAPMETEYLEVPQRITKIQESDLSVDQNDENLFDQISQKSSQKITKKGGKLKLKKKFLNKCLESDESIEQKPKKKRLLSKSALKNLEEKQQQPHKSSSQEQQHIPSRKSSSDSDSNAMKLFQQSFVSEDIKKKKDKPKKMKKKDLMKIKSQEKWKQWQQIFAKQDSEDDKQKEQNNQYYTGMEFQKPDKNPIKRKNKMFDNEQLSLDMDHLQQHKDQQQFVVNIKPKQLKKTMQDFAFFKKAERVLKARQSQFTVLPSLLDADESADKRTKNSLAKLITSSELGGDNIELDLKVSLPCLARGKSNQIMSNTLLLKKMSSMQNGNQLQGNISLLMTNSVPEQIPFTKTKKQRTYTRTQLFKNISKDIKKRKSNTISLFDIKNSFQKTDFSELDMIKKNLQQKKKQKYGLEDDDPNDSDFDSKDCQEVQKQLLNQDNIQKQKGELQNVVLQEPLKKGNEEQIQIQQDNQKSANLNEQQELEDQRQNMQLDLNKSLDEEEVDYQQIIQNPIDQEEYQRLLRLDQDEQQNSQENNQFLSVQADDEDQEEQQDDQQADSIGVQNQNQSQEDDQNIDIISKDSIINKKKNNKFIDQQIQQQEQQQMNDQKQLVQELFKEKNATMEQQQQESKLIFRKLKKMAVVLAEKRKKVEEGKKKAYRYFDDEAQLGSDNQDNDFVKKQINREQQNDEEKQLGQNLDGQLQDLIDNAVYLNDSDEEAAFQKFLADERLREREELSRVIQGKFKINNADHDHYEYGDEDNLDRERRINEMYQQMRKKDEQEEALYVYNKFVDGRKGSRSQSEAEDIDDNPFQKELRLQLQRERALKKKIAQPLIFKKVKSSSTQEKVVSLELPKFKITQSQIQKRGSLLTAQPILFKRAPTSQLSKFYVKQNTFQQTKPSLFNMKKQAKSKKIKQPCVTKEQPIKQFQ